MLNGNIGKYKTTEEKSLMIKNDDKLSSIIEAEIKFKAGDTIPEIWKSLADEYFDIGHLDNLLKLSKEKDMNVIEVVQLIDIIINYRKEKRSEKNWSESDRVRNLLDEMNIFMFDLPKNQYMTYYLDDSFFKWLEIIGDVKLKKDVYMFKSGSLTTTFETKRKYLEYVLESDRQSDARNEAWLYTMRSSMNSK